MSVFVFSYPELRMPGNFTARAEEYAYCNLSPVPEDSIYNRRISGNADSGFDILSVDTNNLPSPSYGYVFLYIYVPKTDENVTCSVEEFYGSEKTDNVGKDDGLKYLTNDYFLKVLLLDYYVKDVPPEAKYNINCVGDESGYEANSSYTLYLNYID
jgi:hypothetical protein